MKSYGLLIFRPGEKGVVGSPPNHTLITFLVTGPSFGDPYFCTGHFPVCVCLSICSEIIFIVCEPILMKLRFELKIGM